MSAPDYVLCLECDSPCYLFEWKDGKVTEAMCQCGNDDPAGFATEDDYEALAMDDRMGGH